MKPSFTRALRNRYLFAGDLVLLTAAAYASYVLRLEKFDLGAHWPGFLLFTALALVITPLVCQPVNSAMSLTDRRVSVRIRLAVLHGGDNCVRR